MSKSLSYRPDIDGLRAIAVLSVMFFHFKLPQFAGGYVGVDAFFVISGYLITRLIRHEIMEGTFTFGNFFTRRVRRLFPAMFLTLIATFIIGAFIFPPQLLEDSGASMFFALFSASNIYFFLQAGYFDLDAFQKPFLHTWSLAVEEQFYLFWPVLLFFCVRKLKDMTTFIVLAIITVISLIGCEFIIRRSADAAFYLTPFRVYEFGIGALFVWAKEPKEDNPIGHVAFLVGLAMIIYSVFKFNEETVFPGVSALVPSIGTGLMIYGGLSKYLSVFLTNSAMRFIGKISYSLYLVHWPVIVYFTYLTQSDPTLLQVAMLTAITFAISIVIYNLVETRFRKRRGATGHLPAAQFALIAALLNMLMLIPAATSWAGKGWSWRVPEGVREITANLEQKRQETYKYLNGNNGRAKSDFTAKHAVKVLVMGDSHAKDMYNVVHLNSKDLKGMQFRAFIFDDLCLYTLDGSEPLETVKPNQARNCEKKKQEFDNSKLPDQADVILYTARWEEQRIPYIDKLDKMAKEHGAELALLGRAPEFGHVPRVVSRFGRINGANKFLADNRKTELDEIDVMISEAAERLGLNYHDKTSIVCGQKKDNCTAFNGKKELLYYDAFGHWSLPGAVTFGKRMANRYVIHDLVGKKRPKPASE